MNSPFLHRLPAVLFLWTAVFALPLVAAARLAGAAPEATLSVCPEGPPDCDYASIQPALDAAAPGDTILVSPGAYTESLTIAGDVTLESTAGLSATTIIVTGTPGIAATGASSVAIRGFTVQPLLPVMKSPVALAFTGGDVVVDATLIRGFTGADGTAVAPYGSPAVGIRYNGAGQLTLTDVRVEELAGGAAMPNTLAGGGDAVGVTAYGAADVTLDNVTIRRLQGGSTSWWEDNFSCPDETGGAAIAVQSAGNANVTLRHSLIEELTGGGPCLDFFLDDWCVVHGGQALGVDATGGEIEVRQTTFRHFDLLEIWATEPSMAIRLFGPVKATIFDNVIADHDAVPAGLALHPAAPNTPFCPPPPAKMTAIDIRGGSDITIAGNVIEDITGGGVTGDVIGLHLFNVGETTIYRNAIRRLEGGGRAETTALRLHDSTNVTVDANMLGPLQGGDAPHRFYYLYGGDPGGDALGIVVDRVTNALLTNNAVWVLTGGKGTSMNDTTGRPGGDAITLQLLESDGIVANNVFFETTPGEGGWPDGLPGDGRGVLVENSAAPTLINNAVVGHETGLTVAASQNVTAQSNAYWANDMHYDGIAPGIYDQIVDPLFVDAWAGDFRLHSHSLLVDGGENSFAPPVDIFGTHRPLDANGDGFNTPDIGVHEYWAGLQPSVMKVSPVSTAPGGALTYHITLQNSDIMTGFAVLLSDTLPSGTQFISGSLSASAGSYGENGGIIDWDVTLAAGGTATLTFAVNVDPGLVGPLAIPNKATAVTSLGPAFPLEAVAYVDAETLWLPRIARP